jgi:CspA family cold shock protein
MSSQSRVSGRVKWFDNRKGFGFVNNLSNDAEVFVHHTGLNSQTGVFRTLYPGEYIEFDLHHDDQSNRDYAVNVTGVKGGSLLCENQGTRLMVRRARPAGSNQHQPTDSSDGFETVQRRGGNRPTRGGAVGRGRGGSGRGGSARRSEEI